MVAGPYRAITPKCRRLTPAGGQVPLELGREFLGGRQASTVGQLSAASGRQVVVLLLESANEGSDLFGSGHLPVDVVTQRRGCLRQCGRARPLRSWRST
jgi:hypothetical protein